MNVGMTKYSFKNCLKNHVIDTHVQITVKFSDIKGSIINFCLIL